jgi:phosphoglycerate dehydrogenase-like enzyme
MSQSTILVLSCSADPELELLRNLPADIQTVVGCSVEDFAPYRESATAILHWSSPRALLREVFLAAPRIAWVHSRSAGLDTLLFPELIRSAVTLTNGTGVFSASLGEFALAAILYFAKDLRRMIRNQEAGAWEPFDVEPIAGKTLAIVGYGDIGRATATRAHALGMKVLALKRHPQLREEDRAFIDSVYGVDALDEVLAQCDYAVLAMPLTPETRGLVGAAHLATMKPDAVLINIGRGPVVDEPALVQALKAGRLKGAALDVFDEEPLPAGHPFYSLGNVLLSPHCADHLPDWKKDAMRFFLEQAERFHAGAPLKNVVDKQRGY